MKNIEYWRLQLIKAEFLKAKLKIEINENLKMIFSYSKKSTKNQVKRNISNNLKLANKINQIDTTKIPYFNSMIDKLSK